MGRYKIYDTTTLVEQIKNSEHVRCLQCEKRLRNNIGNIKRHYEVIHGKFFGQSKCGKTVQTNKKKNWRRKFKEELSNDNVDISVPPIRRKRGRPRKVSLDITEAVTEACPNNISVAMIEVCPDIVEDIQKTPTPAIKTRQTQRIFEEIQRIQFSLPKESKKMVQETVAPPQSNEEKESATFEIREVQEAESSRDKPKKHKSKKHHHNVIQSNLLSTTAEESRSSPLQAIKKMQIVSLNMDRQEFFKCIAETITDLNMPLRYFDDDNVFQRLLRPWTKAFGLEFNSKSIIEHISKMATMLRTEITKIVGNSFICLKLDIVNKEERSIMMVNIQFVRQFQLNIFTIGVLELLDDHFATYLKQQVMNTLERYQIDITKVYSITRDNGSNVKKSSKILQEYKDNDISDDESDDCQDRMAYDCTQNFSDHFVGHALHIVACNIIKQLNENLSQSRDAVKCLRKKMMELNINPIPILDNATRWTSTYEMVQSLLNTRQFVEHNEHFKVEIDWEFARKFEESYKPVYETSMMLQSNQFTIGDFYREWLVCQNELEVLSERNELAMYLLYAMHSHQEDLLENETFLSALYLDQRFCYRGSMYMSDKQKKKAIFHLLIIFNKLKSSIENPDKTYELSSSFPINVVPSGNERYLKLEEKASEQMEMLTNVKMEPRTFQNKENLSLSDVDCCWVEESLEQLQYEEKLTFNTNILEFWKTKSLTNCVLAKIAEIVLAAPATQITINRAFTALPLVLTKEKQNFNSENLESILLLKLNSELVQTMSFE